MPKLSHSPTTHQPHIYACTALLALLIATAAFTFAGIWPCGEQYFCYWDNQSQVASDFGYVRQLISGRSDIFWTYSCGGATRHSFHPTFNNLLSPLTWLVALIPGLHAMAGISILFMLQIMVMPLGALFYLRHTFRRLPQWVAVSLALGYTFCDFLFTKSPAMMLLNPGIIFPFFLYSLDILLKHKHWIPYFLLLILMMSTGTYFAYMWLLFSIIYAASRTGWCWKTRVQQHNTTLLIVTLAAIFISAPVWFPSLLLTMNSWRVNDTFSLLPFLKAAIPVDSCFLPPALAIASLLSITRWKYVLFSRYGLTACILLPGILCYSSHTVWHMMSPPIGYPARFSYMLMMMLTCMAACAWPIKRARTFHYTLLLSIGALMGITFCAVMYRIWAVNLGNTLCTHACSLWAIGVLFLSFFVWKRKKGSILVCSCILLSSVFGLFLNNHVYQAAQRKIVPRTTESVEWAAAQQSNEKLCLSHTSGRTKLNTERYPFSLAFFLPTDSLSHYTATQQKHHIETLEIWGASKGHAAVPSEGGTIFSDTLFGTHFFLLLDKSYEGRLQPFASHEKNNFYLFHNPWYFGMGLMIPEEVTFLSASETDVTPLDVQQHAIRAILGEKYLAVLETHSISEPVLTSTWTYLLLPDEPHHHSLTYDGSIYAASDRVVQLPPLQLLPPHSEVKVSPHPRSEFQPTTCQTLTFREETLDALKNYAQQLPVRIRYHRREMNIECTSTKERNQLFLPLLWQKGYTALADDGSLLTLKNNGGFLSIELPRVGAHHIRLIWHRPGVIIGWILGGIGLLLTLSQFIIRTAFISVGFNEVCRKAMLVFCMLMLILPACAYIRRFLLFFLP